MIDENVINNFMQQIDIEIANYTAKIKNESDMDTIRKLNKQINAYVQLKQNLLKLIILNKK